MIGVSIAFQTQLRELSPHLYAQLSASDEVRRAFYRLVKRRSAADAFDQRRTLYLDAVDHAERIAAEQSAKRRRDTQAAKAKNASKGAEFRRQLLALARELMAAPNRIRYQSELEMKIRRQWKNLTHKKEHVCRALSQGGFDQKYFYARRLKLRAKK